ncbi:3-keto-disaccharide hydrolase [Rosistilla oblonga]|uniref:3-keto-disaccharide hydrolase n=1 Tax=Rosistilla oblonga TaxID=2527990 RepID=UPI003A973CAF
MIRALALSLIGFALPLAADEFRPDQSQLPVEPPADAIVLFDGESEPKFRSTQGTAINWPIENGSLVSTVSQGEQAVRSNHLVSTLHFRDADLHVEFLIPEGGTGNSGIYIHGNYEVQIIDSHGKQELSQQDAGSVYGFSKPLANACGPRGQWQVYDIRYRAPRRDDQGKITQEGSITAWLNGQQVQHDLQLGEPRSSYHPYRYGTTPYLKAIWERQLKTSTGPVFLQDHDNAVRFRNVWVRPLDDKAFIDTSGS